MSTIELKQELHEFVDQGDAKFLKMFHEMAKAYVAQLQKDKMIAEAEEDIKAGKLHSQQEVKDIINNWTE